MRVTKMSVAANEAATFIEDRVRAVLDELKEARIAKDRIRVLSELDVEGPIFLSARADVMLVPGVCERDFPAKHLYSVSAHGGVEMAELIEKRYALLDKLLCGAVLRHMVCDPERVTEMRREHPCRIIG